MTKKIFLPSNVLDIFSEKNVILVREKFFRPRQTRRQVSATGVVGDTAAAEVSAQISAELSTGP